MNRVTVGSIYDAIDQFAPFDTQMDFDNAGLLVGGRETPVSRVLLALDVTGAMAAEAKEKGCELIVSHHPVIFHPLRRLRPEDVVYRLIADGLSVISAHTNYDVAHEGVNRWLGEAVGLKNLRALCPHMTKYGYKIIVFVPLTHTRSVIEAMASAGAGRLGQYSDCAFTSEGQGQFRPLDGSQPFLGKAGTLESVAEARVEMICTAGMLAKVVDAMKAAHPYEEPAYDVLENRALPTVYASALYGELAEPLSPQAFAEQVKAALGCERVKIHAGRGPIRTVGLCGGAGSEMLFQAMGQTDAYLTSEVKHHEWLAAQAADFTLLDAGHFATENIAIEPLRRRLATRFPSIQFERSERMTDPVSFL